MIKQLISSLNVIGQSSRLKFLYLILLQIFIVVLDLFSIALIIPGITIFLDFDSFEIFENIPLINTNSKESVLLSFIFLFIGLTLLKVVCLFYAEWKAQKIFRSINIDLSYKIYSYFIFSPWKEIIKKDHADIIRNILSDTELFVNQGLYRYITIFKNLFLLITFVMYLLTVNIIPTLIVLGSFVLFTLIFVTFFKKRSVNMSLKMREYAGYRFKNVSDSLLSLRELKLINNENYFIKNFISNENKLAGINIVVAILNKSPRWLMEILIVFAIGAVVFFVNKNNVDIISLVPTIGLYLFVVFRLIPVFTGFSSDLQAVRYSKYQIDEVIKNVSKINSINKNFVKTSNNENDDTSNNIIEHDLKIKNLSFSYEKDLPLVFDNINLDLKKDKLIGIEGKNGSGKSTLVDLISGLLEPNEGEILFNNDNIYKNISSWQKNIGYVSQTVYLSNDSVKDNILFGRQNVSQKKLESVIELTELNEVIKDLPQGLDTKIGSLGNFLSGGQKQRIAIARALLDSPPFIILDEATNALDKTAEIKFFNIINKIKKDRIIIIISHSQVVQKICELRFTIKEKKIIQI